VPVARLGKGNKKFRKFLRKFRGAQLLRSLGAGVLFLIFITISAFLHYKMPLSL
jgi:hypothetical protein